MKMKKTLQFNVESMACIRVGGNVSEMFPVSVRLRQGLMMSPCLSIVHMDGMVRETNVGVRGSGLFMYLRSQVAAYGGCEMDEENE